MASCRVSTNANNNNVTAQDKTNKKQGKIDHSKFLIFKPEFLKVPLDSQTVLASETRLAERQWLGEQLNRVKLQGTHERGDTI